MIKYLDRKNKEKLVQSYLQVEGEKQNGEVDGEV